MLNNEWSKKLQTFHQITAKLFISLLRENIIIVHVRNAANRHLVCNKASKSILSLQVFYHTIMLL